MNCGYGHGSSVLEVIDVVKRVSGVDFEVRFAAPAGRSGEPRREGRPPAAATRMEPKFDDLAAIVEQALRWEAKLPGAQGGIICHAVNRLLTG